MNLALQSVLTGVLSALTTFLPTFVALGLVFIGVKFVQSLLNKGRAAAHLKFENEIRDTRRHWKTVRRNVDWRERGDYEKNFRSMSRRYGHDWYKDDKDFDDDDSSSRYRRRRRSDF